MPGTNPGLANSYSLGPNQLLRMANIGESITGSIHAGKRWNHTGVRVSPGERYSLAANGGWVDWHTVTNPNGYASPNLLLRIAEGLRRMPSARWFRLVGSIGKQRSSFFGIGEICTFEPTIRGELLCFANDVVWMYFNNSGAVNLRITRER